MTHDDLIEIARRPALNRYQRDQINTIAHDLRTEWTQAQREYDAHQAWFIHTLEPDPNVCQQLRDDFGALLNRTQNAITAEAFPRAMAYLAALGWLVDEYQTARDAQLSAPPAEE